MAANLFLRSPMLRPSQVGNWKLSKQPAIILSNFYYFPKIVCYFNSFFFGWSQNGLQLPRPNNIWSFFFVLNSASAEPGAVEFICRRQHKCQKLYLFITREKWPGNYLRFPMSLMSWGGVFKLYSWVILELWKMHFSSQFGDLHW